MADLYENILQLCRSAGITGGKLCDQLGFSRSTLSDLKSGRVSSLSSGKLQKIADFFHVTVDVLLNGQPQGELTPGTNGTYPKNCRKPCTSWKAVRMA